MALVCSQGIGKFLLANGLYRVNHVPGLFCKRCYQFAPLLYPPHRWEEGIRIKTFPLDGERLDRGESLSHMPPFSSSVGERKIMIHFVMTYEATRLFPELIAAPDGRIADRVPG
jgi:hypothetical protein